MNSPQKIDQVVRDNRRERESRQAIDRPWRDYPMGTKAFSCTGGYWTKTERGWKWATGSTFPTPGADAILVALPEN